MPIEDTFQRIAVALERIADATETIATNPAPAITTATDALRLEPAPDNDATRAQIVAARLIAERAQAEPEPPAPEPEPEPPADLDDDHPEIGADLPVWHPDARVGHAFPIDVANAYFADQHKAKRKITRASFAQDCGLHMTTAGDRIKNAVEAGTLKQTGTIQNGPGRPTLVYSFVPEFERLQKRAAQTAPKKAKKNGNGGNGERAGGVQRGAPVAGTGKGERPTRAEVAALVTRCRDAGAIVSKTGKNHWQVILHGTKLGTIPGTPSDHRSLKNCEANLRRKGLNI